MSPLWPTPGETPCPPPSLFFQPFAGTHQCRSQLSPPLPPPSPNDKTSQMMGGGEEEEGHAASTSEDRKRQWTALLPLWLQDVLELTFSLRGLDGTLARESTRRDPHVRKSARRSSEPLSTHSSSSSGVGHPSLFSSSSLFHIFLRTPSLHTVVFLSLPRSKTRWIEAP
ncbi:hypothetical protein BGW80DRAFT_1300280, partial [Lactifluus volemus]